MKLVNPLEVAEGVYQIRTLGANVTAIFSGRETLLVDAGARGSRPSIAAGMRSLGSSLDRVSLIVLTHYHPDHTGGLATLVKTTSAKVCAHRADAGYLDGTEPAPSPFSGELVASITRPFMGPLYGNSVQVDHSLEDGDTLLDDESVTVVHTPGHTPGSICLYMPSRRLMIVGDVLQYRRRRLSPPSASFTQDFSQAMKSLGKLLPLDFETICFSHYPPLRQNAREALSRLVLQSDSQ